MDVHMIINFTAKPEARDALAALLAQARRELPRVPGCKAVRAFNGAADSCSFTLVETWESEAQHQAHVAKLVSSGAWDQISRHLARPPSSGYFHTL